MEREYYLLNFAVSGIKNIEKEITLEFYNKTIDKAFNPDKFRVKAIYGENGSGKTAIVSAIQILKDIILRSDYLTDSAKKKGLAESINKKTKKFEIKAEFLRKAEEESIYVYKYAVTVKTGEIGSYEIERESLDVKNGDYTSSVFKPIFECNKGELTFADLSDEAMQVIHEQSLNLLGSRSMINICLSNYRKNKNLPGSLELHIGILDAVLFASCLHVSLEESDQHELYILTEELRSARKKDDYAKIYLNLNARMDLMIKNGKKEILKENYKEYEKEIKRLTQFIKLFKQDLINIEINRSVNGDYYVTSLVMDYGKYKIDSEYESNGIKRLIKLFNYMNYAVSGDIVFIDEMDSNINDIYLTKLVEFFMVYGKGQLCFTTHNTSPMSVLRKNKKSIDFLSNDNRIVSWKTNGNFAPDRLYKQGMIEYLPFNIEPEDFLGLLGD